MVDMPYLGPELEVFEKAENWRAYMRRHIAPHLHGAVLEVGAGIGTMTKTYLGPGTGVAVDSWLSLEPDPRLCAVIQSMIDDRSLPSICSSRPATLGDLDADQRFDAILYVDVLEHIEDDKAELERAFAHLNPGGRLVVMSPAHQWLFSALDEAAGHFRRYTSASLLGAAPAGARLLSARYLDCVGMAASLANRLMLRQGTPKAGQIRFWDGVMVPASRILDPLLVHALGKSVLAIWEKP
jgi:SAM-dependent methyltransferase